MKRVAVEQRDPMFSDAEVGAIGPVGGGDRYLVHADHDPVDVRVGATDAQLTLQPAFLGAPGVAADVGVATVLQADVVVVEADDANRPCG